MAKLKPKAKAYYAYFSTAAHAAGEAAGELAKLAASPSDRAAVATEVAALAEVADEQYRTALSALRGSFVTPFDRTEIQDLSRELARSVRHLEGSAALIHLLNPPELPADMQACITVLGKCAELTEEALSKLRKLKGIKHFRSDIAELASEAEFHRRQLLVQLTTGEMEPLDAVKLRAVSDELSGAVEAFVDVAETVETILITEG